MSRSSTTTRPRAERVPPWPDEPAKAHYQDLRRPLNERPLKAYCGTVLLGFPAPEGFPLCDECKRIKHEVCG